MDARTDGPVSIPPTMMATKVARQMAYSVPIILPEATTSHSHIKSTEISTSIDPKNICSTASTYEHTILR